MKRLLLIILILLATLTSCKFKKKTLTYGTTERLTEIDPAKSYDFHTWELFRNINIGLLRYIPETSTLIPGLAFDYFINKDVSEYTFKLRDNLKFSDGTPFNAQAVKWSIDRVMKLKGEPSWLVTDFVKEVKVMNEFAVRFILHNPCGFFPSIVATIPYFPINPANFPEDKFIVNPVELTGGKFQGLGAYRIKSFKRNEKIILERNPNYYDEPAKTDRIVIKYFKNSEDMKNALLESEIDLAFKTFKPFEIKELSDNSEINNYKIKGPQTRFICFETSESNFKDKNLRKAVSFLLNRKEIIGNVYRGQNSPLYSMVPTGMSFHTDNFVPDMKQDRTALANKLLNDSGYNENNILNIELWFTPTHYGDSETKMADLLKEQIEKSPLIKVTVKSIEWTDYKKNWLNKKMPMYLLGWYPDYIDPDNYIAPFAGTNGSKGMGINFSDEYWDSLIKKEQSSIDKKRRRIMFYELQRLWVDECPTIPLLQGDMMVFTRKNVSNVKIGPTLFFYYNILEIE